ncbi:MAG: hypothetical protein QM734_06005 [Cyclobacteriaceae bacterium]
MLRLSSANAIAELGAGNTSGLTALSKNLTDFLCTATGSKNGLCIYGLEHDGSS